jgi:hypothetical protein
MDCVAQGFLLRLSCGYPHKPDFQAQRLIV